MTNPHLNRDTNILLFIWLWKLTTTAAIKHRFFNGKSCANAYKGIHKLKTKKLVQAVSDRETRGCAWTLTRKGYQSISDLLPALQEKGFKSECPRHDIIISSVQFEEKMNQELKHLSFITEQQLRRYENEILPDWVPDSDTHRPDGYWKVDYKQQSNIIGLEVELSRKTDSDYEYISSLYDNLENIARVLWVVPNKRQASRLNNIMNENESCSQQKHNFVLLDEYYKTLWSTPIFLGPEKTFHLGHLLGLSPEKCSKKIYYSPLLDSRKFPMNRESYRIFDDHEFRLCMDI